MSNLRLVAVGLLGVALASPAALAQDISSNDGSWRASLDAFDPSGGVGQITNLFTPASSTTDNLFETLWFEGVDGGLSSRVENNYTNTGSVIGTNSATFSAVRNDGIFGLDVSVFMADGAGGGAQFTLTWTNLDSFAHTHKAYAYTDMDVDGTTTNDASWTGSAVNQTGGTNSIFFGNDEAYKGWEIDTFADLRTALDGGVSNLANTGGGVSSDWTAAVAGFETQLAPGESYSFTFSFNAVPAPGALALLGLAGLAGTRRRRN